MTSLNKIWVKNYRKILLYFLTYDFSRQDCVNYSNVQKQFITRGDKK